MLGRVSSENPYVIIAQREILEKTFLELSEVSVRGLPCFQVFNQTAIEKLVSMAHSHKHQARHAKELQPLAADEEYLRELYLGCLYSLAFALSTSPADFESTEPKKNKLFEAGATEVDDESLRRAAEDAFESSSGLVQFSFQDLETWKNQYNAFFEEAYQEFLYGFYRSKVVGNKTEFFRDILLDIVRDFYFTEASKVQEGKVALENALKTLGDTSPLPSSLKEFRDELEQALRAAEPGLKSVGIDPTPFALRFRSLHANHPFLAHCPVLSTLPQREFQDRLRIFLNTDPACPALFERFANRFRKRDLAFEVRCPIYANFYESAAEKFGIPDLSSIHGMLIQRREPRFSPTAPAFELVLPRVEGHSVGQVLSEAKAVFTFAVDMLRAADSLPAKIEMLGELSYKNLSTSRVGSGFQALHKPWISDYDGRTTKFIQAYARLVDDKRPVAERFRRAIKLHSASKSTSDSFMRLTLMWSMFTAILDSEEKIIQYLPFLHFCHSSGGRFNQAAAGAAKREVYEAELTRFKAELIQIRESKEATISASVSHAKRELDLQSIADALEKYRESAKRFITYAALAEEPAYQDTFDYLRSIEHNLAESLQGRG